MVQIEVLQDWTGEASGYRQIAPGVYDAKDERLYGCAGYLLQHGYARRVVAEEGLPAEAESELSAQLQAAIDDAKLYDILVGEGGNPEDAVPEVQDILSHLETPATHETESDEDEPPSEKPRRRSR